MVLADLRNAQHERAHPCGQLPGAGAVAVPLAVRGALVGASLELLTHLGLEHLVQHLLHQDCHPAIALDTPEHQAAVKVMPWIGKSVVPEVQKTAKEIAGLPVARACVAYGSFVDKFVQ